MKTEKQSQALCECTEAAVHTVSSISKNLQLSQETGKQHFSCLSWSVLPQWGFCIFIHKRWDTGTGCPEKLWMPPPWRGVGNRWSLRFLPTQTTLWFYDLCTLHPIPHGVLHCGLNHWGSPLVLLTGGNLFGTTSFCEGTKSLANSMTAPAGESKKLLFLEKSNKGEHPFSLQQVLNTFSVWADPILLLSSKNSNSFPIIASTTDQCLSLVLSVASTG